MGAQIILCDGFEVIPPPEMNDLILFGSEQSGSNCDASTVTTEEDGTVFSGDSSPGGLVAEEEWPGAKQFSFYFVKQPAFDDPVIRAQIDEADQEIYYCNKRRIEISNMQRSERAEISSLVTQVEGLVTESEGYKVVIEEKMKEFDTLQEGLRNLRCSESDRLCFTKEELDHLISMAHYVIAHGSVGIEEKDWLLNDKEKSDEISLSEDSLAQKEESMSSLKLLAVELSEVKQELEEITLKSDYLTTKMGIIQNNVRGMDSELAFVLETRDKSCEKIKRLRINRDKGNAAFFQSLAVLRKAKELAASGNVRDLEEFASSEVDRFMTHWNDDKAFRDDYVKRSSISLYERQLSQDGRIRAPESEVQVVWENQAVVKARKEGVVVNKTNSEDSSSNSSQDGNVITDKQKKETRRKAKEFNRSSAEESDVIDLEFPVYENPKKQEEEEVDEETLKERKREEQLEKARLAMERKRKLQEKAAAKAAIRAQKEAEKKLKECEKKAKKKAAANSSSPSESDHSREVTNEQEKVKTSAVAAKEKHQKERSLFPKQRSFRYKHRGRGTEALPKAILNRRRAHRYWVWGISSAVLALVLVLLFLLLR